MSAPATRPLIAVTMGDAAGVGPEIIVKALADPAVHALCEPVVVGDAQHLRRARALTGAEVEIVTVEHPDDPAGPGAAKCLDCALLEPNLPFGQLSAAAGEAAYRYVERAAALALDGAVDAICTAPLNREALHLAGRIYTGHTDLRAELTGAGNYAMMLTTTGLRVIHVTTHIGLVDAIRSITPACVERVVRLGHSAVRAAGIDRPRIVVCAINPHAGENGTIGYGEEAEKIEPALRVLRADGIDARGPHAADSAFFRAVRGDFDLVVAMYHDQGHAAVKVLGIDEGVCVTVGLPVVRTSVDHGTAFDIAGTGAADPAGLEAALREAARLASGWSAVASLPEWEARP
jgi:4-hydroxythreonine-4-phosphate dehydrogenase